MRTSGRRAGAAILAAAWLGGCANGDFDRVKPGLVLDSVHDWVGTTAALGNGAPISSYPLTDDERALRDLAYPLIEPPYDRQRWFSILNEYGIGRIFRHDWSRFDEQAYTRALMSVPMRSEAARYARLNDDVRNDRVRIPPFFDLATRVLDMDRRRQQGFAAVPTLTGQEQLYAVGRIAENELVISWVQWSLVARLVSYRFAFERLFVAAPMPAAADVERSLLVMQNMIARYRVLPGPDVAPGPGILPEYLGPIPAGPALRPLTVLGRASEPKPPESKAAESKAAESKAAELKPPEQKPAPFAWARLDAPPPPVGAAN
jgi:hypothetical protein